MKFLGVRSITVRQDILFCLCMILFVTGRPAIASTIDTNPGKAQAVIWESLTALWTGRDFSPALAQRQHVLKTELSTGAVRKDAFESILETTFLELLDHQKTSRYILRTFPESVNTLFAPYLNWDDVNGIMWRALSSVIDKDDPLLFTAGTLAPPGTPWINVAETLLFPRIEKLSDGKILLKIYGGGAMGEDTDILKKMDEGRLDSCGCTAVGLLAASPDIAVLLVPGLFNSYEEVDYICEKFRKRLDEGFENNGYLLAALIDTGFFYLFAKSGKTGLSDLKKQKVLSWFGDIETSLYQELEIPFIPGTVSEIVTALNTAVADSVLAPAAWMLGMQAYQYANYYLKPPLFYSPGAVLVSTKAKDRMQKQAGISATFAYNIQEIILSEFYAIENEWKKQIRGYEKKSLRAFEAKCRMQVIALSDEDRQLLEKAGKAVEKKLTGTVFSTDLINDIQKSLFDYRAVH